MTFIFRNMWRRKGRTFLTIFGIVVGIFALTVLGGMSARLNQQVQGMKGFITGKITVSAAGTNMQNAAGKFLNLAAARQLEQIPGVASASGLLMNDLKVTEGMSMSIPQLIVAYEDAHSQDLFKDIKVAKGKLLSAGESGKVALGSDLANQMKAKVGQTVNLKGRKFQVVGILDTTMGVIDGWAFVPYADGMAILQADNPYLPVTNLVQSIVVLPKPGVDIEALASTMKKTLTRFKVMSPVDSEKQISQMSTIFNAIILGIAFIALFVGGLSVINTMVMAVSERTREIGLKKAIGAKVKTILGEYLEEAAAIGLMAGITGMLLGLLAISLLNQATHKSNVIVFSVTTMVIVGPVIFATVLGTVAGLFPALRAARLNPVDSLKEE
ncbi:MAG TPA: ABC transporter permease [Candidatus Anoxymicrobiaceae bacterium]